MRGNGFIVRVCAFVFLSGTSLLCAKGNVWQSSRTTSLPSVQTTSPPSPYSGLPDMNKRADDDPSRQRMEEAASKARNTERFRRIQAETDRLLKLSNELKADVDKTTKNEMSLDVIRKAEEIERLAHDVKERMKG